MAGQPVPGGVLSGTAHFWRSQAAPSLGLMAAVLCQADAPSSPAAVLEQTWRKGEGTRRVTCAGQAACHPGSERMQSL